MAKNPDVLCGFAVKQINCALYEMPKLARFTFANFDSAINLVNPHST